MYRKSILLILYNIKENIKKKKKQQQQKKKKKKQQQKKKKKKKQQQQQQQKKKKKKKKKKRRKRKKRKARTGAKRNGEEGFAVYVITEFSSSILPILPCSHPSAYLPFGDRGWFPIS